MKHSSGGKSPGVAFAFFTMLAAGAIIAGCESNQPLKDELAKISSDRDQLLYLHYLDQAQEACRKADFARAKRLLDACPAEQRHWEWHYLRNLCPKPLRVLSGHQAAISGIAANGQRLYSCSWDKTIRVWDTDTGTILQKLEGHREPVSCLAVSADGTVIVSGDLAGNILIRQMKTGQSQPSALKHGSQIRCLAVSPDGGRWASAGHDGFLRQWDVQTGAELESRRMSVNCVVYSSDGEWLAAGTFGGAALFDAHSGIEHARLPVEGRHIEAIAFDPGGKTIATASSFAEDDPPAIKLWSAETLTELWSADYRHPVKSLAFNPDGTRMVVVGDDPPGHDKVAVLDTATGRELTRLEAPEVEQYAAAFSPDGGRIYTGGADGAIREWDPALSQDALTLVGHEGPVACAVFSPDGSLLASAGNEGIIQLWDGESAKPIRRIRGHSKKIDSISFSPDGTRLVSAGRDERTLTWNVADGSEQLAISDGGQGAVAFSPDGKQIAGTRRGREFAVWNTDTGEVLQVLSNYTPGASGIAFSRDGTQLFYSDGLHSLQQHDLRSAKVLWELDNEDVLAGLALSHDGRRIATGTRGNRNVTIWDTATKSTAAILEGHDSVIHAIVFSPDSRRIATACDDGTVKIWDVATGRETITLAGHTAPVNSIAFRADGRKIATASRDGTVKIWRGEDR